MVGSPGGRGRVAALGSLAHKASRHQANLEGEPGWCSAGAHQPPGGAARRSPRTPGASLRGGGRTWAPRNHHPGLGGQRGLTAAIPLSLPFLLALVLPLPVVAGGSVGIPCSGQTLPGRATVSLPVAVTGGITVGPGLLASLLLDLRVNLLPALLLALTRHPGGIFKVCVGCNNSYQ